METKKYLQIIIISLLVSCNQEKANTTATVVNGDTIQSVTLYDSTNIVQVKDFDKFHAIESQFIILPAGDTIFDPKLVYTKDYTKLLVFLPLRSQTYKDEVFEDANLLLYRYKEDVHAATDTIFYGQVNNETIISIENIDTTNLLSRIYYKHRKGFAEVYFSKLIDPNIK